MRSRMRHMALCALATLPLARTLTSIQTFSDPNCGNATNRVETPDSTGSGPCNQLRAQYESFMITDIGEGCGVTIYGNVPFCSSPQLELAELGICYNTTWVWYSVDNCEFNQIMPTTSSTTSSSATPSTTSQPPTTTTTSPTVITVIPEPTSKSTTVNAGAIAGGTVAGVAVIAIVVLYLFAYLPAQKRKYAEQASTMELSSTEAAPGKKDHPYSELPEQQQPPIYEMPSQYIAEVDGENSIRFELPA